jgi:beta-aspartyl-peptidase (threonine type)
VRTDREERCRRVLRVAVDAGMKVYACTMRASIALQILRAGGTSLDACCASVRVLEDDADFNSGHGAVLTADGTVECDASIMDGYTGDVGGVTGVRW